MDGVKARWRHNGNLAGGARDAIVHASVICALTEASSAVVQHRIPGNHHGPLLMNDLNRDRDWY